MQNAEFIERISPFSTNQYSYIMQQLLNSEINIKSEPNKKKNIQASSIYTKVFVFKIKKKHMQTLLFTVPIFEDNDGSWI